MNTDVWIGVDLDGTLAEYDDWRGSEHIGKPIARIMKLVKHWLRKGYKIKILTARPIHAPIQRWLIKHKFGDLEITNQKDFHMIALLDDRAISVNPENGKAITINPNIQNLLK